MSAAYIQAYLRLDFIMEANIMVPVQTAHLGAARSGCTLFAIKATYEHKQMREQTTKVVTVEKGFVLSILITDKSVIQFDPRI